MRQIGMRDISLRITCCYQPSLRHSHSTRAHYTLFEALCGFLRCVVAELPTQPTILLVLPHRATHAHRPAGIVSCAALCMCSSNYTYKSSLAYMRVRWFDYIYILCIPAKHSHGKPADTRGEWKSRVIPSSANGTTRMALQNENLQSVFGEMRMKVEY